MSWATSTTLQLLVGLDEAVPKPYWVNKMFLQHISRSWWGWLGRLNFISLLRSFFPCWPFLWLTSKMTRSSLVLKEVGCHVARIKECLRDGGRFTLYLWHTQPQYQQLEGYVSWSCFWCIVPWGSHFNEQTFVCFVDERELLVNSWQENLRLGTEYFHPPKNAFNPEASTAWKFWLELWGKGVMTGGWGKKYPQAPCEMFSSAKINEAFRV